MPSLIDQLPIRWSFLLIHLKENDQPIPECLRLYRSYLRPQSASILALLADSQVSPIEQLPHISQTVISDGVTTTGYAHRLKRAYHFPMIIHADTVGA
jgi:hypothetical protein